MRGGPLLFFLNIAYCMYLAMLVLSCRMWDLLVVLCGIQFPDQEWNPGPLLWKHRVLATGPSGKPPFF